MKRLLPILLLLVLLSSLPALAQTEAPPPPPKEADPAAEVEAAIYAAINASRPFTLAYLIYDTQLDRLEISADNRWATAWLNPVDPSTGQVVPAEPGLAVARHEKDGWTAYLPGDAEWLLGVQNAPLDLLAVGERDFWLLEAVQAAEAAALAGPFHGYYLPWAYGESMYLTQGPHHDYYTPSGSAHYALDFAKPGAPSGMFNLHAAKGGTVKRAVWHHPNGNPDYGNYIVLEDTTTSPTTYQLYLHLAQDSIPEALRVIGAPVARGQFLGVADDTGISSGNHLHFHVHLNPSSYWDQSQDITFVDVAINGGRPRIASDQQFCTWDGDVCDETQSLYVSGNMPGAEVNPPWGDLLSPATGFVLETSTLNLAAWADDDSGIASMRFQADFGNGWQDIGPAFTASPAAYLWDACAASVPDGPLSLAVKIVDTEGNSAAALAGLRHILKQYACPIPLPACSPGSDQVALYAGPDYKGDCVTLGVGDYSSANLGALGDNNAASIRVGGNVRAAVFNNTHQGRGETYWASDANLEDNRIGGDRLSSLKVQARSAAPSAPRLNWPPTAYAFPGGASFSLAWEDSGGATQFRVKLNGVDSPWQSAFSYPLASLTAGGYTWQVQARNASAESAWSVSQTFTVQSALAPAAPLVNPPVFDDMETSAYAWTNSANWDKTLAQNHTPGGTISWGYEVANASTGYDNGSPNYGDLTSPPISIPSAGYAARFWYYYETEGPGVHWDQRWVQISQDNGPFVNVLQLSSDPPNVWLQSPAIDLSPYSSHSVRIRLHFETMDAAYNAYKGWYIDDFSVNAYTPPACSGGEPDGSPAQARLLSYGASLTGEVCPAGDVDYFKFAGSAGDQIAIAARAQADGSALDTYIYLLDSDFASALAQNDDQVPGVRTDSFLSYRLTRSGDYYIQLKAWNHPGAGGEDYGYTLTLNGGDQALPSVSLAAPASGVFLPNGVQTISVNASDSPGGVGHVDFYWHTGDWQYGEWELLGADWDASDGWGFPFDTTTLPDQRDIGIFVRAYDWAGNARGAASWNLWLDRTPPVTAMSALPASQKSTAIPLAWSGADNLSGLAQVDIQRLSGASWVDWQTGLPSQPAIAWFIGSMGSQYSFRMRGRDLIGNTEAYPTAAEATTAIASNACSTGDAWENDNSLAAARALPAGSAVQEHTFCNPAAGNGWLDDQDWYRLTLRAGERLFISAQVLQAAAPVFDLFASDGVTLLASASPQAFGQSTPLTYYPAADMTAYLRVSHLDGAVAGDDVIYRLRSMQGYPLFLPIMNR
ncbi:MAG: Ig-like domain-containing protein [Chloroflexi bacterium]|nr:Ig-like domain-containing protein [Chloroflexota bacterium]